MKTFLRTLIVFMIAYIGQSLAQDGSITGDWKTIDDETGKAKSIVHIYEQDGKYFGRIDSLLSPPPDDPNPVCDKCPDDDPRKDQPIKGMVILEDLEKDGDEYTDGRILDPKKGKIYDCKMWLEDGNLKVRGYLLFFYRTQTWYRAE
ncbi:MAG: DUF2147 domain-containing protein [Caldithrix sp.]|nr:DUF2147 domain-containing protein [Caldithrix sp.]